jgi:hypothetical protein
MSLLLGAYIEKVVEEDFEKEKEEINEEGLRRLKVLMLAIKKAKRYDLVILAEGSIPTAINQAEKDLNMLERANLVKGELRFTSRDTYRRYVLTKKGDDLAESLMKES